MNATMQPEQAARREIDRLLAAAGWAVQAVATADLAAGRGVAIREFPLLPGHGFADYLLYVDAKACGVIEAKKQGATLTGVEAQSARTGSALILAFLATGTFSFCNNSASSRRSPLSS